MWQDQNGADRSSTEIVLHDMKLLSPRSPERDGAAAAACEASSFQGSSTPEDIPPYYKEQEKEKMTEDKKYLAAAAAAVERQLLENPGVPIPVDPDVAAYMGAMEDDAMSFADALESSIPKGEGD